MSRGLFERLLHKHSAPAELEEEIDNPQLEVQSETIVEEQLELDEANLESIDSSELAQQEPPSDDETEVTEEQKKGNAMSALLASDVAPELKKRALRSLFFSGQFSEVDELNDYAQDFSQIKPLSADVASKLRNWTREKVEQLEELAEDLEPTDESQLLTTDEQSQERKREESDAEIEPGESQLVNKKETHPGLDNNSDEGESTLIREDATKIAKKIT
ncbi:DUF3306 domain-containing protein [Vibrio breoganii]|uniref:DUF3306 domain-containing protein n=1 Tax=Vibrio breoganii TaxID=553239 RepID=UPI00080DA7A2|nr:DUF3306 domain-containing protein [Vibrio breoganii]OCH72996.1 hypothetical protein A6D95_17005 [Vibrio breoganii]PMF99877.1 hypothetical protein BCV02_15870 [Vibrio breoganii]PMG10058.1 hypothetical protein BCV00_04215 [Vibrio breoganii]PMG32438.1 hypothetical protein BCU93_06115 [Vibrio breoganii]PMG89777.1 hypothetical protein BCU81_07320 [Vibrio breoganii]